MPTYPFQPVPNGAEVMIDAQLDGQDCFNILHFRFDGGPIGLDDLSDLVLTVGVAWQANALLLLPVTYRFNAVRGKSLETATAPRADSIVTGQNTGDYLGDFMSNNDSIAISHKGGVTGRNSNGRSFWPSLPRDRVIRNMVAGSYAADCIAVFDSVMQSAQNKNWAFCTLSRVFQKVRRPQGVLYDVINNTVADLVVDSQRRRLPKRGK